MDWKEKILTGMKLIHDGCKEVEEWANCNDCPFSEICMPSDSASTWNFDIPSNWTDSMLKGE